MEPSGAKHSCTIQKEPPKGAKFAESLYFYSGNYLRLSIQYCILLKLAYAFMHLSLEPLRVPNRNIIFFFCTVPKHTDFSSHSTEHSHSSSSSYFLET